VTALQLHRVRPRLFEEAARVSDRLVLVHLVRKERHIGDHQSPLRRPRHRRRPVQHLLHRHRQRRLQPQHHHPQRVAHQDRIDSRLIHIEGGRIVISRQQRQLLPTLLLRYEFCNRDAFFQTFSLADPLSD
jgi:hypothetical protein